MFSTRIVSLIQDSKYLAYALPLHYCQPLFCKEPKNPRLSSNIPHFVDRDSRNAFFYRVLDEPSTSMVSELLNMF